MALNPEFLGRVYPPSSTYVVGREKVREFAQAIGDDNPAYHDVEAARALGYADVITPPTFAFAVASRAAEVVIADPDLGLDYSRVVHGEQRFSYTRPIVAGDELSVTSTVEAMRSVAGNDMLTVRGDVTGADGQPVVSATMLLVARGTDEASS